MVSRRACSAARRRATGSDGARRSRLERASPPSWSGATAAVRSRARRWTAACPPALARASSAGTSASAASCRRCADHPAHPLHARLRRLSQRGRDCAATPRFRCAARRPLPRTCTAPSTSRSPSPHAGCGAATTYWPSRFTRALPAATPPSSCRCAATKGRTFVRGPYLVGLREREVTIVFDSDLPTAAEVRWGAGEDYGSAVRDGLRHAPRRSGSPASHPAPSITIGCARAAAPPVSGAASSIPATSPFTRRPTAAARCASPSTATSAPATTCTQRSTGAPRGAARLRHPHR